MWSILALGGAFTAAVSSILQKETLKKLHAVQLMTASTILVVVFLLFLLPFYDFSLNLTQLGLIALFSIVQSFAAIFTVRAMRHMDVSVVAPFFNLGTAFTAIMAWLIFKETLTLVDVVGITLLIAGGYLLELKHRNLLQPIKDVIKSSSIHYLLGGVFLFSSGYLLAKYILETVHPISFIFYQQVGDLIIFSLITFTIYKGFSDVKDGFKKAKWLLPLMAILLIAENLFMFKALKVGEASLVVPLYRTWTLWAVIFGGRILHEGHLVKRAVASILMIGGAALILV